MFACLAGWAGTNSSWFTRVWQTDDGLPNNHVTAISADGRAPSPKAHAELL